MSKTLVNFWLDAVLLLLFLVCLWTTFVIRFVFPPGTLALGWSLWGATYDQWADLQFWLVSLLVFAVLIHVMLHWTWVCGVITSRLLRREGGKKHAWNDGERTLIGVGFMVVLLAVLGAGFAAAKLMMASP